MDLDDARRLLERRPFLPIEKDVQARAAVAAILRTRDRDLEVLLIRRADRGGDPWSGHMAFPGGRGDPRDASLLDTALRETREEVGLDLRESADVLGRLDDLRAVGRMQQTGLVIAPFVFGLRGAAELAPNDEVAELHWVALGPMQRGEVDTELEYPYQGVPLKFPGYQIGERIVWGLTYRMLQLLFERLQD